MMAVLEWHYSTFPAETGVTRANKKEGKTGNVRTMPVPRHYIICSIRIC